ncbi:hypothetical protein [Chitinimonas koreensis]|uniref:hypothetical protein n=1 Tax=Chitinimonas koreensis TaxID=356302 RepID=UPI0004224C33|nr:hypothetical protein [Chitinimonas koreensis]QNM96731.1 hypothetical protein H9L41_23795 [Chitinimonas koreensis]
MASSNSRRPRRLFPIGALIFSAGVEKKMQEGRLDPMPYFHRHTRGDWGDVSDLQWFENNGALTLGGHLDSIYVVTRELTIRIYTEADRSATYIALPSEACPIAAVS